MSKKLVYVSKGSLLFLIQKYYHVRNIKEFIEQFEGETFFEKMENILTAAEDYEILHTLIGNQGKYDDKFLHFLQLKKENGRLRSLEIYNKPFYDLDEIEEIAEKAEAIPQKEFDQLVEAQADSDPTIDPDEVDGIVKEFSKRDD